MNTLHPIADGQEVKLCDENGVERGRVCVVDGLVVVSVRSAHGGQGSVVLPPDTAHRLFTASASIAAAERLRQRAANEGGE